MPARSLGVERIIKWSCGICQWKFANFNLPLQYKYLSEEDIPCCTLC